MKKLLCILLLLCITVTVFAGCDDASDSSSAAETSSTVSELSEATSDITSETESAEETSDLSQETLEESAEEEWKILYAEDFDFGDVPGRYEEDYVEDFYEINGSNEALWAFEQFKDQKVRFHVWIGIMAGGYDFKDGETYERIVLSEEEKALRHTYLLESNLDIASYEELAWASYHGNLSYAEMQALSEQYGGYLFGFCTCE